MFRLGFVIIVNCLCIVLCQLVPKIPCPNVFTYQHKDNFYCGKIKIPYDGTNELNLAVNASIWGAFNNLKLHLRLLTPTDTISSNDFVEYRVDFPVQRILPRITTITLNNQIYCEGPPEPLTEFGVTKLWSNHIYSVRQYNGYTIEIPAPLIPTPSTSDSSIIVQDDNQQPEILLPNDTTTVEEACGIANDVTTLTINWEKTRENQYPWLAALFLRSGTDYEYQCNTNLITHQHVLTAGKCVRSNEGTLIKDILLVMGRDDISNWASNGALTRSALEVQIHPDFASNSAHSDIALITMNEPVPFSLIARPICLWDGDTDLEDIVNTHGITAGWGISKNGETEKFSMPIVSQQDCLRSNLMRFASITSPKTFCAGRRDGTGPCAAYRGAAFMIKDNGRWYLRGIAPSVISKGVNSSCDYDLNDYVVFSDVSKAKNWIQAVIQ